MRVKISRLTKRRLQPTFATALRTFRRTGGTPKIALKAHREPRWALIEWGSDFSTGAEVPVQSDLLGGQKFDFFFHFFFNFENFWKFSIRNFFPHTTAAHEPWCYYGLGTCVLCRYCWNTAGGRRSFEVRARKKDAFGSTQMLKKLQKIEKYCFLGFFFHIARFEISGFYNIHLAPIHVSYAQ